MCGFSFSILFGTQHGQWIVGFFSAWKTIVDEFLFIFVLNEKNMRVYRWHNRKTPPPRWDWGLYRRLSRRTLAHTPGERPKIGETFFIVVVAAAARQRKTRDEDERKVFRKQIRGHQKPSAKILIIHVGAV